jgi:hypothetical protein
LAADRTVANINTLAKNLFLLSAATFAVEVHTHAVILANSIMFSLFLPHVPISPTLTAVYVLKFLLCGALMAACSLDDSD